MEKNKPAGSTGIVLSNREKLTASGVSEVTGFDEVQIEARTEQGLLLIRGMGLRIENFDAERGELSLTGRIDGLVYTEREQKRGFLAGLLR